MSSERYGDTDLVYEYLKSILNYEPQTGLFIWLVNRRCTKAGNIAGTQHHSGYMQIKIDGKIYFSHRLAWFYMKGIWPANQIDHKDTDKLNNKFDNLREATNRQNQMNVNKKITNTSGIKGVCWDENAKRWKAQISIENKTIYLGIYDKIEDAGEAYRKAAKQYFGEYANLGMENTNAV